MMDARRFKDEVVRVDLVGVASAASFWLFLALLPLLAVAGMIAAKLAVNDTALLTPLLDVFPSGARDMIQTELEKIASWNAIGPISIVVFVWLASTGVHALLDAFDKTTERDRPWWKKRLLAIAICVLLSIGVALVGVVIGVVERGPFASGALPMRITNVLRWAIAFGLEVAMIAGVFALGVVPEARRTHRVWPGALLAAATHVLLGFGYVEWVRNLGNSSAYQAGLATIGVTMISVWVFTFSLLVGLTLNKLLPRSREEIGAHHVARHSHAHGRGAHRRTSRIARGRRSRLVDGQSALRRLRHPHRRRIRARSGAPRSLKAR
jgi:membrane protein